MSKTPPEKIMLMVVPTSRPDADVIGFHAVASRLPSVDRYPGETLKAMVHRALWMVEGEGPLLVYPRLKD
jgi:hypothetical protein